jgi:nudix-type nucleoside diphosphatase (YffH/AdpP family)
MKWIDEGYGMNKNVEIVKIKKVFKKAIFEIEEAEFKHEIAPDQWSKSIFRLNLIRGDAVAVLVHNIDTNELIFTDQFRYSTFDHSEERKEDENNGWMLELPAGMIDLGETPDDAVRREIMEEIGYRIHNLEHLQTFFLSPGTSSEKIFLYYATVSASDREGQGGGLVDEGEFIKTVEISVEEAIKSLNSGGIRDSKTIIGLQWLQNNKL